MEGVSIRAFSGADENEINALALAAFSQFKEAYNDWPQMAAGVSRMSRLADIGEIIVAEERGTLVGGVAYIPADAPKAPCFDRSWPIIRMLVVAPSARGQGLGRKLTEECIRRAKRDDASVVALHTSPIMTVALPMYLRMGFQFARDTMPVLGVPYAVYTMALR